MSVRLNTSGNCTLPRNQLLPSEQTHAITIARKQRHTSKPISTKNTREETIINVQIRIRKTKTSTGERTRTITGWEQRHKHAKACTSTKNPTRAREKNNTCQQPCTSARKRKIKNTSAGEKTLTCRRMHNHAITIAHEDKTEYTLTQTQHRVHMHNHKLSGSSKRSNENPKTYMLYQKLFTFLYTIVLFLQFKFWIIFNISSTPDKLKSTDKLKSEHIKKKGPKRQQYTP